jgi:hypothetical protein
MEMATADLRRKAPPLCDVGVTPITFERCSPGYG